MGSRLPLYHRALQTLLTVLLPMLVVTASLRAADVPRLLVLQTGRVIEGQLVAHPLGYMVSQPGSPAAQVLVTTDQIRCAATDRTDAYRQQRDALRDPSASDLVALAEWCLAQRLYEPAIAELRRALAQSPDFLPARRLLKRVEDQRDHAMLAHAPQSAGTVIPPSSALPPKETLGGLKADTAERFVRQIQPLVLNRCGGSGCHGPQSQQQFRLTAMRGGHASHRRNSEKNLDQILQYIDVERPLRSPLLRGTEGQHGGQRSSPFVGAAGREQIASLREWVQHVAAEQRQEELEASELLALPRATSSPVAIAADATDSAVEARTDTDLGAAVPLSLTAAEVSAAVHSELGEPAATNHPAPSVAATGAGGTGTGTGMSRPLGKSPEPLVGNPTAIPLSHQSSATAQGRPIRDSNVVPASASVQPVSAPKSPINSAPRPRDRAKPGHEDPFSPARFETLFPPR
jgi:hypothetical protein